jgi:hypothetical protein
VRSFYMEEDVDVNGVRKGGDGAWIVTLVALVV